MILQSENWQLNNKEDEIEFFKLILNLQPKVGSYIKRQLWWFQARNKSAEDLCDQALDFLLKDMRISKVVVGKHKKTTRAFLYNYAKREICKFIKEEKVLLRQHSIESKGKITYEVFLDRFAKKIRENRNKSDKEKLCKFLLENISQLATVGTQKVIEVIISDNNDLFLLLYPITKELTEDLIEELLNKGYIDKYGDVTEDFKDLRGPSKLKISKKFIEYHKEIYKRLKLNRIIKSKELIATYLNISIEIVSDSFNEIRKIFRKLEHDLKLFMKDDYFTIDDLLDDDNEYTNEKVEDFNFDEGNEEYRFDDKL